LGRVRGEVKERGYLKHPHCSTFSKNGEEMEERGNEADKVQATEHFREWVLVYERTNTAHTSL
jgi:hypothetical protein